jgi:hypothetical protein
MKNTFFNKAVNVVLREACQALAFSFAAVSAIHFLKGFYNFCLL